jgi:starch synthase
LFVLPSRAEPFGIVILEALASRKAVVATKAGGIPEIIQDGVTGVLVAPDDPTLLCDAMRDLLRDQAFRERLADQGYRLVAQQFHWPAAGERYESMFRALYDHRAVPYA